QLAGPAFDASIWEIWPYLCSGASLHLVEEEVRLSPALVRDWLIERAISIAFLPTPLAEATLMLEWPEQLALRTMLTGGDRLHSYRPASLPFTLVNNYGPTENTAVTTAGVVASRAQPGSVPSIGRPIANNQVYILDHQLQPVPVGVVGELYIGGTGLARGYLFKPELTATSFIPHPFSEQPGARLYRTGDLVRYLPDQSLEFWGRVDFQVKVRGYRIELGAIEAILQAYPNVGDVVVVLHEESKARKYLVAYLVILKQEEGVPTVQQLQTYLREQLPDHMIPTSFVFLPSLPISTNGKVDRKMLPPPDRSQPTGEAHIAPRSQMEQALAQIWQEVLGLKQIGIHENFFSLGGHSLLATQVISQIRSSLGLEVTLKLMFQSPTIAELAAAVQHLEKNTFAEPQIVRRSGVRRTIQK
ncbi:MAG TPA: non-ribosomal peptide synthetase, partial [Ktedonobacteraceae bacterium]|nr:non-ribosomal peptide synthetase [Ktedonobacteraceae bacterium]